MTVKLFVISIYFKIKKYWFDWLLWVMILASVIYFSSYIPDLSEPKSGEYNSDEQIFLKTYYLMEQGAGYYSAFNQATAEDNREFILSSDVFVWRWPTLFYLWKWLANDGRQLWHLFWIFTITTLVSAYYLVKSAANKWAGLMATGLLILYLKDITVYQTSFLFIEWWGIIFFIIGLSAFWQNKLKIAWILFLLSVAIRELIIIPIIGLFIISLIIKSRRKFFVSLIFIYLVMFLLHLYLVRMQFDTNSSTTEFLSGIFQKIHGFDKLAWMKMAAFSFRQFPLLNYKINMILIFCSGLGLVLLSLTKKIRTNIGYLYLPGWLTMLILPFISTSNLVDYWGIIFMPLILISVPLLFNNHVQIFSRNPSGSRPKT